MKKLFKFTFFIIVVLFIGNTSFAQEKEKFEAKCTGVFTKYHRIEVNDPSEHTFSLYEAKGAGTMNSGGFSFINYGTSRLVKGKGIHNGINKVIYENGDFSFSEWEGNVTPIETATGKSTISFEGTWTHMGGTGRWENAEGKGTYKGSFVGDGIYVMGFEGEYTFKK